MDFICYGIVGKKYNDDKETLISIFLDKNFAYDALVKFKSEYPEGSRVVTMKYLRDV